MPLLLEYVVNCNNLIPILKWLLHLTTILVAEGGLCISLYMTIRDHKIAIMESVGVVNEVIS